MFGLVQILRLHPDLEQLLAAVAGDDAIFPADQSARDQREQIARLLERVVPDGEVTAVGQIALVDQIAVGEQHRIRFAIGAQRDGVRRHDVGTVEEVGDLAKALGFALREEVAARDVQSHERRVLLRTAAGDERELERGGRRFDRERFFSGAIAGPGLAVEFEADQLQPLTHQFEVAAEACRVAVYAQSAGDGGHIGGKIEVKLDGVDQIRRGRIVRALDDTCEVGSEHGR